MNAKMERELEKMLRKFKEEKKANELHKIAEDIITIANKNFYELQSQLKT